MNLAVLDRNLASAINGDLNHDLKKSRRLTEDMLKDRGAMAILGGAVGHAIRGTS